MTAPRSLFASPPRGRDDGQDRGWSRAKVLLVGGLVASYTFLLFTPTLFHGFVYDDRRVVLQESAVSHPAVLLSGEVLLRRSLRTFTLALDRSLWGEDPFGYHLTNVLIHVLVVVSLLALLLLVFRRPLPAVLAALFFAAHPVHVEVVAGISNRKDSLALLFALLSLCFFQLKRKSLVFYLLSLASLFLSFLAKEIAAVAIPLVFVVTDFLARRRESEGRLSWGRHACYYLPLLSIGAVYLLLTGYGSIGKFFSRQHLAGLAPGAGLDYGDVVLRAICALGYNIKLLYLPWSYAAEYPVEWNYHSAGTLPVSDLLLSSSFVLGLVHVLGLPLLLYYLVSRRHRTLTWAVAFFSLTYIPVSNLIPFINRLVADRLLYTPSTGYAVVLGVATARLCTVSKLRGGAVAIAVLLIFSLSTLHHSGSWRSSYTLWKKLAHSSLAPPSAIENFTFACIATRRFDEGIEVTEKFLERFPGKILAEPLIYGNLAVCLRETGKLDRSTTLLLRSARNSPSQELLTTNLGINAGVYYKARQYGKSEAVLSEIIDGFVRGNDTLRAKAHYLMGLNKMARGQLEKAREQLLKSLDVLPTVAAYRDIAELAYREGELSEAMEHLESALRLEPGHAPTERVLHRLRKERAQKGAEGDVEEKKGTEGSERKDRAAGGPEASAEP